MGYEIYSTPDTGPKAHARPERSFNALIGRGNEVARPPVRVK